MTIPDPAAQSPARVPEISWPSWLPADGSSGVPHFKPGTSEQCPYIGLIVCRKCRWTDDDAGRVQRARALLDAARRVVTPETRAAQRQAWKAAVSAGSAKQRRGRARRPGQRISGYAVRFPRKDGGR